MKKQVAFVILESILIGRKTNRKRNNSRAGLKMQSKAGVKGLQTKQMVIAAKP